ncbi:c-type cytochrome [Erythrobacter tepidarius]|uniref:c-type cytochrome n=1 Tax=Erythrobacter tepidarius TaxID=60454 RepID=UPI000A3B0A06|nr:c-type cytochrome [Erythrobacter tepidarius]
MTKTLLLLAAATAAPLAALAALASPPAAAAAAAASPPAAPAAFAPCAVCHAVKKGERSGFGPNLYGVAGTRAGAVAGYAFSPAMKKAEVVWNRDTLDRFIAAPQAVVPGTKMAFAGVKDAAKRKAIVDYLMALK